jgi:deferrochelatase/peroxidase EfeB
MSAPDIDYDDIQGLVRYGYGRLTEACFFLLAIEDRAAARAWLLGAPVTTAAERRPPPTTALQVAFTREGLDALGVPADVVAGFSAEFVAGMAGEESRSRRLGDVGASAPAAWRWGGPGNVPHVLVMLYAVPRGLEAWTEAMKGPSWNAAFRELHRLATAALDGFEPFGFRDGVSQPWVDWKRQRAVSERDQLEYTNEVALGEVLLGYPNEYGKYTDRPLIDARGDSRAELPQAEDAPDRRDVGRNGTYLVFRELSQDVRGFWQFLDAQAGSNRERRQALAEAMVGRAMSGEPLIAAGGRPIPGVGTGPGDDEDARLNQFSYESDPGGLRCPLGAHIRRANPRNADLPGRPTGLLARVVRALGFPRGGLRSDALSSTRFHRLVRRGREYGLPLSPDHALRAAEPGDAERGLHFIGLNANISRQFEFVQSAWIMSTKFDGLTEESDPLMGNRAPIAGCPVTDTFSVPQGAGVRRRIRDIPQFVTVRGGAYFLLPGIRALRFLAGAGR